MRTDHTLQMVPKLFDQKMKERVMVLDECREHRKQRVGGGTSSEHFVNENPDFPSFCLLCFLLDKDRGWSFLSKKKKKNPLHFFNFSFMLWSFIWVPKLHGVLFQGRFKTLVYLDFCIIVWACRVRDLILLYFSMLNIWTTTPCLYTFSYIGEYCCPHAIIVTIYTIS